MKIRRFKLDLDDQEMKEKVELNKIYIVDNNQTGTLLESFGGLQYLEYLFLGFGNIGGSIPRSVSNLTSLWYFTIIYHSIGGTIPSLAKLEKLETLQLQKLLIGWHTLNTQTSLPAFGAFHERPYSGLTQILNIISHRKFS